MVWKLGRETVNKHITLDRLLQLQRTEEYPGICIACGAEAEGVEPDARHYTCAECREQAVYGVEEILIWMAA
jgi:hypothetical protein